MIFLFKQKTAYEMRISDWSSDVCSSDLIERATGIARNMVTKWGLSTKLGPLAYADDNSEVFLGKSVTQTKSVSDETAHTIDEEVRKIIEANYATAKSIIVGNHDKLHSMAAALLKYETIDIEQIKRIFAGQDPRSAELTSDLQSLMRIAFAVFG